jgi:putative transposase
MSEAYGRGRPPRLSRIFQSYAAPLFFITICTWERRSLLAGESIHTAFCLFSNRAMTEHGVAVGRYVLMPDHMHLFVRLPLDAKLQNWVNVLKNSLGKALRQKDIPAPHWQRGFFDHLMRSGESYSEKWEYVRMNPVRAGLVEKAESWPYQGEVVPIRF